MEVQRLLSQEEAEDQVAMEAMPIVDNRTVKQLKYDYDHRVISDMRSLLRGNRWGMKLVSTSTLVEGLARFAENSNNQTVRKLARVAKWSGRSGVVLGTAMIAIAAGLTPSVLDDERDLRAKIDAKKGNANEQR